MIRGQNNPLEIALDGDINFSSITSLSVLLVSGTGSKLKHWSREDVTFNDNILVLPITENESMGFPVGLCYIEVKALDQDGKTLFWSQVHDQVIQWTDDTLLTGEVN